MNKWFQPLFENDGAAGGAATGGEAGTATQEGSGGAAAGSGQGTGAEGNQGAGTDGAKPGWLAGVKVELRDKVEQFKTPSELAQAFIDSAGKLETSLAIPGDNATDEEKAAFRKALGVPESPDNYELEHGELPEGMSKDEAFETWFRETAHDLGLSKTQAKILFDKYSNRLSERFTEVANARKAAKQKTEETLIEKLGSKEEYDATLARARRAVRVFGSEEFDKFLEDTGLTNDPRMIVFMAQLGKTISDDVIGLGTSAGQTSPSTDPNDLDSWDFPKSLPEDK